MGGRLPPFRGPCNNPAGACSSPQPLHNPLQTAGRRQEPEPPHNPPQVPPEKPKALPPLQHFCNVLKAPCQHPAPTEPSADSTSTLQYRPKGPRGWPKPHPSARQTSPDPVPSPGTSQTTQTLRDLTGRKTARIPPFPFPSGPPPDPLTIPDPPRPPRTPPRPLQTAPGTLDPLCGQLTLKISNATHRNKTDLFYHPRPPRPPRTPPSPLQTPPGTFPDPGTSQTSQTSTDFLPRYFYRLPGSADMMYIEVILG